VIGALFGFFYDDLAQLLRINIGILWIIFIAAMVLTGPIWWHFCSFKIKKVNPVD